MKDKERYRKEPCSVCGELVGIQGMKNHLAKHLMDQHSRDNDAKNLTVFVLVGPDGAIEGVTAKRETADLFQRWRAGSKSLEFQLEKFA